MPVKFPDYRVKDNDALDSDHFNRRWRSVDGRISFLEDRVPADQAVIDDLRTHGLDRIEDAIGPSLARIQAAASLGFLLGPAADNFEMTFGVGPAVIPIRDSPARDLYTPTPFVAITRTSTPNDYAVARVTGWNRETGVLSVSIEAHFGMVGPFSDIQVEPLVGGALAVSTAVAAVAEDRVAVEAAEAATIAAKNLAVTAKDAALGAQSAAETARSQAQTAASQAQAAATGGIKVVVGDTTQGYLDAKVTVSGAMTKAVSNPTGNSTLGLTVREASTTQTGVVELATTGEATAGSSSTLAVTPAGLAAAIAAIGASSTTVPLSQRGSNTALAAADKGKLIDFTAGFTQTFAACSSLGAGWYAFLRNNGGGDVGLDPNGSEQIDGVTSYIMYPGESRLVTCDGSALRTIVMTPFCRVFTASGSFAKPPGYSAYDVECQGAGGGGAGGGTNAANSEDNFGGGGGSGGAYAYRRLSAAEIGASETVTIGAAGGGGGGRSAGSGQIAGLAGNDGGATTFGAHLGALGGKGGVPGFGTDAARDADGGRGVRNGVAGAAVTPGASSPFAGGVAVSPDSAAGIAVPYWGGGGGGCSGDYFWFHNFSSQAAAGGRSVLGGPGGGGGGGNDTYGGTFNECYDGGAGGAVWIPGAATSGGGGAKGNANESAAGGAGTAGTTATGALRGTGGGGGGGGRTTGGNGGAGGRGAGGGGGGGGYSGAGGNGGAGGAGTVRVTGIA